MGERRKSFHKNMGSVNFVPVNKSKWNRFYSSSSILLILELLPLEMLTLH